MKAELVNQNGNIKIKINDEVFTPQCFRSFQPEAESIKRFSDAGIRLMNVFPTGVKNMLGTAYSPFGKVWLGEGQYNWANVRRQLDLFIENAPDAYFMLMLQLDTRDWFLEQHPDVENSFAHFSQTAGCAEWRESAARFMCDMIDYLDEQYPEKIYGVMLCAGGTNEWYSHQEDYARHSKYKQASFEKWCGDASAKLPSPEEIEKTSWGIFRHPKKDRAGVAYWRFFHDLTADTINYFAKKFKEHTKQTRLVGVAQGYLMDYKNDVLPGGYMGLWETLDSDDIDIFIAPASYWFRGLDSTSSIRFPVDSIKLHNKLYIHSLDNITHLANDMDVAKILFRSFSNHVKLNNLDESREYFKRETSLVLSKGMGYWWFGMYPQWYNDSNMMEEIQKIQQVSNRVRERSCGSVSEIAVFVDQASNYYLDSRQIVTNKNVWKQPEPLYRLGAPWDNFHMNDVCYPAMPHDQYKLYLFLNLIAPTQEHLAMLQKLRDAGKSILFLYAPGIVAGDDFSIDSMSELAGITLKELKDAETQIVVPEGRWNKSNTAYVFGYDAPVEPMFYADDSGVEVIGRFKTSRRPAVVIKDRGNGFDAWAAAGTIPAGLLRELAAKAGVFIFLESEDPLYLNESFLGCFAHKAGRRTFRLPSDCVLREMYSGEEYQTIRCSVEIEFKENETKLFERRGCF